MTPRGLFLTGTVLSGSVGLAVSTGALAGIVVSILLPAVWVRQTPARFCFYSAFAYYLSALWSVPVVARNFFGPNARSIDGIVLWLVASALLALPWRLVWSASAKSALWRVPIGLLASIVPPLGLIGWASPTVAAGLLFPATAYAGFARMVKIPEGGFESDNLRRCRLNEEQSSGPSACVRDGAGKSGIATAG